MSKSFRHTILLLTALLLLAGCQAEPVPTVEEPDLVLTVRCTHPEQTKAETEQKMGDAGYNENLILSVDFLFYAGENPAPDADALYHVRKELKSSVQANLWEASFNLLVKKDIIEYLFNKENGFKGTVRALVNFDPTFIDDMSQTSRNELDARTIVTDFAQNESNYIQPSFLMDGETVITFDENATPAASGEINVSRLASKLTIALNVADEIILQHSDTQNLDEYWTPVKSTMRIYLVDGVKSVLLGGADPDPEYFSYKGASHERAYVKDNGIAIVGTELVTQGLSQKLYYHTYPMYSYPASWSTGLPDHTQIDYTDGLPPEPPYFKLEMDWRREARNGYTYDRRKYYYKVFLPFDELKRNNWYGFYLDVSILGSETDEGKAILTPTCYLLDWQNKELAINKYATISKARYLAVDKTFWEIDNMNTLSIPFTSSHNVTIIDGTVKATRPFYGELKDHPLNKYDTKLHATVKQNTADGSYYLDYVGQPSGQEQYEPSNWLSNTSTSIELDHALQNDYSKDDFDYSPYTITFDINHTDLAEEPESHTYKQYVQHITIIQYPGIYIDRLTNHDTEIVARGDSYNPYGYPDGELPWLDKPWGYVYVNGGRFVRYDQRPKNTSPNDPFYKLTNDAAKREFQWQTVWYTGGTRDLFNIHVTVLPSTSTFVIGDPREDSVNNLDNPDRYPGLYIYTVGGNNADEIWSNLTILEKVRTGYDEYKETSPGVYQRIGFNEANALYGESWRPLMWYYPTEKSTRTENMLAPSYRIASKFGGTEYGGNFLGDLSKEYAEYRCAGFQEDGFPAGRWRLPTKAEIHFIAQLSAKKAFERLFSFGGTYWSAHGAITVNNDGSVSNSNASAALLRCVYDSWYWDSIDGLEGDPRHDPEVFLWGDKER